MRTIRATLHHGNFREVTTYRTVDDVVRSHDVVRALAGTAYGTSLDFDTPEAHKLADELNRGEISGRGWVHLELVETVGIFNAHMAGMTTEPGEYVDWSAPDFDTAEGWRDVLGMSVEDFASISPHLIIFEA